VLKEQLPKLKDVTFQITAPDAQEVFLAADFNGWRLDESTRMELRDGAWVKRMKLEKGVYHYRFVIDGQWSDDPQNPYKETNPFGEKDSLIEIKHT